MLISFHWRSYLVPTHTPTPTQTSNSDTQALEQQQAIEVDPPTPHLTSNQVPLNLDPFIDPSLPVTSPSTSTSTQSINTRGPEHRGDIVVGDEAVIPPQVMNPLWLELGRKRMKMRMKKMRVRKEMEKERRRTKTFYRVGKGKERK